MRTLRPITLLAFLVAIMFGTSIFAQQPTPMESSGAPLPFSTVPSPVTRDPKALAIVQAALGALGGDSIAQVQSCVINIESDDSSVGHASGTLVLTISGSQFRSNFQGPNGTYTLSSGNGAPYSGLNGKAKKMASHVTRAWFWPQIVASTLLSEFQNSNYSFEYKGTSTIDSQPVVVVSTVSEASGLDALVTPQIWYFSAANGLPVRVEYRLPDAQRPRYSQLGAADLSDYQSIAGVLYPFVANLTIGGHPIGKRTITSIQPNASISPSEFDSPAGGLQ